MFQRDAKMHAATTLTAKMGIVHRAIAAHLPSPNARAMEAVYRQLQAPYRTVR
jgi:hypothetical protein